MSTSSNPNYSYGKSMSSNWSYRRDGRERGFPKFCRKNGEGDVIFTANRREPIKLFHGCPNGSEKTDKSLVEEVEDLKCLFDEKMGQLVLGFQTCEDVIRSYDKEIENLGNVLAGFEKEMKELVHEYGKDVKSLKMMTIRGVEMMIAYYYFAM